MGGEHHHHKSHHHRPSGNQDFGVIDSHGTIGSQSSYQRDQEWHGQNRDHAHQQSTIFQAARSREWMGNAYTFNASPLSWFQRYNAFRVNSTGIYRQYYRDENYASSGSIPPLDHDDALYSDQSHQHRKMISGKGCCTTTPETSTASLCIGSCCKTRRRVESTQSIQSSGGETGFQERAGGLCSKGNQFCLVLLLTAILVVNLVHVSRGNHSWTLNPGESFEITPAYLIDTISIKSEGTKRGAQVYAIPSQQGCPPLTGPLVTIASQEDTIFLAKDSYQFQYFYLNEGSSIHADIVALSGSANVFLLRGDHALRQLENSLFFPPTANNRHCVMQQFVSSSSPAISSTKLSYQIQNTDTYILIYENPTIGATRLLASLSLDMTTYDLSDRYNHYEFSPTCNNTATKTCFLSIPFLAPFFRNKGECFIVQTPAKVVDPDELDVDDDGTVTIHITQHRRHGWIVLLSFLPLLTFSMWPYCGHADDDHSGRSYRELYEAVSHFPPVAFSPHYFQGNHPSALVFDPLDDSSIEVDNDTPTMNSNPANTIGVIGLPMDTYQFSHPKE